MGRTFWIVVGAIVAGILALALAVGPGLYRHGRELVGPIMDLAASEKAFDELDAEMSWQAPEEGRIDAARLDRFLAVRAELLPTYRRWEELERELTGNGEESLDTAKVVLAELREVFAVQEAALRAHDMSPAEFRWLEEKVYEEWLEPGDVRAAAGRLEQATRADLEFVAELRRRYGESSALGEVERRLEERLDAIGAEARAPASDLPPTTVKLLESRHADIAALDLARYGTVHDRFWQRGGSFSVEIGD